MTVFAEDEENGWVLNRFDYQYDDLAENYYICRSADCRMIDESVESRELSACFFYLTKENTFAIIIADEKGNIIDADSDDIVLNCRLNDNYSQIEMYYSDYKKAYNPVDRSSETYAASDIYSALQKGEIINFELCCDNKVLSFSIDGNGYTDAYDQYESESIMGIKDVNREDNLMVNALKVWSVGKTIGLTDAQCAAMLGNMHTEGGIDPYRMECDFAYECTDYYGWCDHKEQWKENITQYTEENVFGYYAGQGVNLNKSFYRTSRFGSACGVGLCGFTGSHYDDLVDFAAAAGTTWYDDEKALDIQLAFILAGVEKGGYEKGDWLMDWVYSPVYSVSEATYLFNVEFEGNTGDYAGDVRLEYAEYWYNVFAGKIGDPEYGQYVLGLSQTIYGE